MQKFSNSMNTADLEIPDFLLVTKHTVDRIQTNITAPLVSLLTSTASLNGKEISAEHLWYKLKVNTKTLMPIEWHNSQ